MGRPAVSVVIPTYNRAKIIRRAVSSILAQCDENDEVIIVDDGSTDETERVISDYGNKVIYHRIENGGPGHARNVGIDMARNDLIAFLDSDDEWIPGKLRMQRDLMDRRRDLVFCCSDLATRYMDGKEEERTNCRHYGTRYFGEKLLGPGIPLSNILPRKNKYDGIVVHIGDIYLPLLNHIFVQSNTVMIRRGFLGDDTRFPEDLMYHEDWEFYSRLSKKGPVAYIDCDTARQYFHDGPQLDNMSMVNIYKIRIKVLDRVWGTDRQFLNEHGNRFRKRLREQRLLLVEELFDKGMLKELKEELRKTENPPLKYLILRFMPVSIINILLRIFG